MTPPRYHTTPNPGRWFPHPLLSLLLACSWLALAHSLALIHVLSAFLIGWTVPRLLQPFLGSANRIHWPAALRLVLVVLLDIVRSNVVVARLVLGPMGRPRPAWVVVPLQSAHPMVNSLLATIITTTPGTVSATVNEVRHEILVHVLDCDDPAAVVSEIKERYERPLLKVFQVEVTRSEV